jgi:hypothetical protein
MTDPTNDVAMRRLRRTMEAEAKFYRGIANILDSFIGAIDPALPEEQQAEALAAARAKLDALKASFTPPVTP